MCGKNLSIAVWLEQVCENKRCCFVLILRVFRVTGSLTSLEIPHSGLCFARILFIPHMLIVTLGRLLQRKYTTCSVKSKSWSKLNLKVEASPQMKHFQMVIKFYQASKFCPTFVEVSISKSKMAHSDWVDF